MVAKVSVNKNLVYYNYYKKCILCIISILIILSINLEKTNCQLIDWYKLQRSDLPSDVFQLFYHIKDALDYGSIGNEIIDKPFTDIDSFFNSKFLEKYSIAKYKYDDYNYILIIIDRGSKAKKYKATRERLFTQEKGKWIDLGCYIYK